MPERSLLGILARTAYWIEWWRRFGPASGSDPKIKDPFGRYVLATFVYGINMSAADAARHIVGTSTRDLALVANRHVTVDKLNEAITDVINAGQPSSPSHQSPVPPSGRGAYSFTTTGWSGTS